MIDPALFTVQGLLDQLLDDCHGGRDIWRKQAEIIAGWMPQHTRPDTTPKVVVRFEDSFLRFSHGPAQGYFWDIYGDDFIRPSLALIALLQAPVPPSAIHPRIWDRRRSSQ